MQRMRRAIQRHALQHSWNPEAMVAVKVGETQPGDGTCRDTCEQKLALSSLSGVEQQALAVPAQQITVVIPVAGRYLAGGTEHDQLAERHV